MAKHKINVLFVCTGNLCRSPLAEYLLRSRGPAGSAWRIGSAGLAAAEGLPASRTAIEVAAKIGLDLAPHRSRALTGELVAEALIIPAMTRPQIAELQRRFPAARDRVHLLGDFHEKIKGKEILDPIGCGAEVYRQTLDEISSCLDGLIDYLKAYEQN